MDKYNPQNIEKKWQRYWEENKIYQTPAEATPENKFYILPQLPYPSGSGLHVGHAEVYSACDVYARYQRMRGKKVLQVIGWDSFGLPAENYAIKNNIHPRRSTDRAVETFRRQIKSLGVSVDWGREVGSHDPDYYKWTQWFFLLFYKRGLAYRKKQPVNWCDGCKTVLANEQVTAEGKCERCSTAVVQREMEQWFLKITDYAERLLKDLDKVDWPVESIKRQRNWIGKSEGAVVRFGVIASEAKQSPSDKNGIAASPSAPRDDIIETFTTRPDTLFGATYLVLAPEGEYLKKLKERIKNWGEVEKYIAAAAKKTELDRQTQKEKTGVELKGVKAVNPANGEELPIFAADYILAAYGTGAIMAVPAHDQRDWEFAKKHGLKVAEVVSGGDVAKGAYDGDGILINSDFLNNLPVDKAKEKMIQWLEEKGLGERKVQYKLRDWSVSRQRFWGAPIPMLRNEKGELKSVPEEDLPVVLPDDVDFKPTGESPLNYSKDFQKGVEEKHGKGWKREPDTLDTFMCSSWYYYRYLDPHNDKAFASPEALKKWMPVDFYLGGPEHVNGHLLYARFFTKVLFDAGYIDFDEPFLKHRHQGLILGEDSRKMSKRWGNVINPTDVVNEYGADTCRMYLMFMGPLEDDKPWNTNGVKGVRRFLEKAWGLQERVIPTKLEGRAEGPLFKISKSKIEILLHQTIKKVSGDIETLRFNTAISQLMIFANGLAKEEEIPIAHYRLLIILLSPFAPHLAEELWQKLGNEKSVALEPWPEYDPELVKEETVTIAVQINGKLRDTFQAPADISEEEAKKRALALEKIQKWLAGKEPRKVIYAKGKMVSIVL